MARYDFGGTLADFVVTSRRLGGLDVLGLSAATLTFWSAQTGGTKYTDLVLNGSAVSSIAVASDGQVPTFQGPDAITVMWVDGGAGRVRIAAQGIPGPAGAPGSGGGSGTNTGVDVKSAPYNAKGDGTTDDTAAIHAARDAAALVGADLLFTPGTYVTTGLTANKANQRWGLQRGATLKAKSGTSTSVIVVTAASVTISGPGTIDGNRPNVTSGVAGVYSFTAAASDLSIEGVNFQHIAGYGVQAAGTRTRVRRCNFVDIAANAVLVVPTTASIADTEMIDNYVDKSGEAAGTTFTALQVRGTSTLAHQRPKILGNTVIMPRNPSESTGLALCIESGNFVTNSQVSDNNTYGGSMGVSVAGSHQAVVSGNNITAPNWYGIELASSMRVTAVGNMIDGDGLMGGGALGGDATSGIITNGGVAGVNSDNCIISGNIIYNMVIGGGSSGIQITSGSNTVITDNNLDVACHGILFSSTGRGIASSNRVKGQLLATSRGLGVVNTTGRVTFVGNEVSGFPRGVALETQSVTIDNIVATGNDLSDSVTEPIYVAVSGTGAIGSAVKIDSNVGTNERAPSYPHTAGESQGSSSSGFSANRVYYVRSRGSGWVTSVGLHVGAPSGNIRLGVYRASGTGRAAVPGALVRETGSVACPAAGYQTVALTAPAWMNAGDYFAVVADNGVATIVGFSMGASSAIAAPYAYHQDPGSFTLPATATPSTGQGNIFRLIGI